MRKKKLLFIIPILALGIILYLNYKEDKKNEIVIKNKRTYKIDLDSSKVVNHQLSFTDELIFDNKLYLNDYSNQQIIEATLEGNEIKRYGKYGEGPKENLLIRGFNIDKDAYYTSDTRKHVVSKITFNDSLIYYYKTKSNIETSGFLSQNKIISKGAETKDNIRYLKFVLIDPENKTEHDVRVDDYFDVKLPNSEWIFDGAFTPSKDGGAFYITHYSNNLIKFNNHGKIEYAKNLIYEVPKIQLQTTDDMTVPIANDTPQYYSASADDYYIYIQSSIGDSEKGNNNMIIDLYEVKSGNYKTSIAIPSNSNGFFPNSIEVYKNQLFLFYEQYYSIHKMKQI